MRVNVGCGAWPLPGWINIDEVRVKSMTTAKIGVFASVPPLPFPDGCLEEIYAGHFVEHLPRFRAVEFIAECHRCLKPGGLLGIVVPDTRAVMEAYVTGRKRMVELPAVPGQESVWVDTDCLDDICSLFLYSTVQDSPHQWSYDLNTLRRLVSEGGFKIGEEINRWFDRRIPLGAWYQCGLDATKE